MDARKASPNRKTKIVCTIGPTSWTREAIFRLAEEGMDVVRLNMSHGDHKSHQVGPVGLPARRETSGCCLLSHVPTLYAQVARLHTPG